MDVLQILHDDKCCCFSTMMMKHMKIEMTIHDRIDVIDNLCGSFGALPQFVMMDGSRCDDVVHHL